jgi:hypothetical protein
MMEMRIEMGMLIAPSPGHALVPVSTVEPEEQRGPDLVIINGLRSKELDEEWADRVLRMMKTA